MRTTIEIVRYRRDDGTRPAILLSRRGRVDVVYSTDAGVTLRRIDPAEQRYMVPLDYPARRAVRAMLVRGNRRGMTAPARRALRDALDLVPMR